MRDTSHKRIHRDQIADDKDAAARKPVDEPEKPLPALSFAGQR